MDQTYLVAMANNSIQTQPLPCRAIRATAAVTHYHAEITFQPSCCPSSAQLYLQLYRRMVSEEILKHQVSNTYKNRYMFECWEGKKEV